MDRLGRMQGEECTMTAKGLAGVIGGTVTTMNERIGEQVRSTRGRVCDDRQCLGRGYRWDSHCMVNGGREKGVYIVSEQGILNPASLTTSMEMYASDAW